MAISPELIDLQRAYETEDPDLPELMVRMAFSTDLPPEKPVRQGAMTFSRFLTEIRSKNFHQKSREEQVKYRMEQIQYLESSHAEVPLPDRLRMHSLILDLWKTDTPYARNCLLKVISAIPLVYGPWRALKKIAKEAEERMDTQILGALASRFDMALANGRHHVSEATLAYLCRRMWRYLRKIGQSFPVAFPDTAVDFLAPYQDNTRWRNTWIANHIFFHKTGKYSRRRFSSSPRPSANLLKDRAFDDLWKRTPRPLFSLLERAESEQVRSFAVNALQSDFRTAIRAVEPVWVARLVTRRSPTVDLFVIWILENVPQFEQSAFRKLGLHEAVLNLFDSPADKARTYATGYARMYARDMPVTDLIRLINNDHSTVRELAEHLILERDPRTDIGLEPWAQLLETRYGHKLAARMLQKYFGASELTPEWFQKRLRSFDKQTVHFARNLLLKVHDARQLKTDFFVSLIDELDQEGKTAGRFALTQLENLGVNHLDVEFLQRLFVHPHWSETVCSWIDRGILKATALPTTFYKILADSQRWADSSWIADLKNSNRWWASQVHFDPERANHVWRWLADVRLFSAADLGFEWLIRLVKRGEPPYCHFAEDLMIKSFTPADFAGSQVTGNTPGTTDVIEASDPKVDLDGQTFVFTGKLSTMTRKEAQKKVLGASGRQASAVTPSLDYLVIGDQGSPLYGQGKKGKKQLKAEALIAEGHTIRIISETAFLQMLSGKTVSVSSDAQLDGCQRLWEMAIAEKSGSSSLSSFAITYLRRHHPDISLAETDRPVDPGAEVPEAFFAFDKVYPLFFSKRPDLREFALLLAQWEFARWSPPAEALVKFAEADAQEVRTFVRRALLSPDKPENRRYRLDPEKLPSDVVYRLCESTLASARQVGMDILNQVSAFQQPEALFRLTQSPDHKIRAFVIRMLWSLYRKKGITSHWKPVPSAPTARQTQMGGEPPVGDGPRLQAQSPPADNTELYEFLRRILFEIPPARPGKRSDDNCLKPLPARKAKLFLIEVLRDLALEDALLAKGIMPLLTEFMGSRGKSEQAACLVAVTRIRQAHHHCRKIQS